MKRVAEFAGVDPAKDAEWSVREQLDLFGGDGAETGAVAFASMDAFLARRKVGSRAKRLAAAAFRSLVRASGCRTVSARCGPRGSGHGTLVARPEVPACVWGLDVRGGLSHLCCGGR